MDLKNVKEGDILFNNYVVIRELGRGTYGHVYEAKIMSTMASVAIKISHGTGQKFIRNAIEARTIEWIGEGKSPLKKHVIGLKEWFKVENCVVLILEFMPNTLRDLIAEDLNLYKISLYSKQMIDFLSFMSQMNIIHGDLKPENILHSWVDNRLKFADFGLCHMPHIIPKLSLIQTLPYRAPEVIIGCDYDNSVDMWSVGCILLECVTRKVFFDTEGDRLEQMQMIDQIFGPLPQDMIVNSPYRNVFYHFHEETKQWILNGSECPEVPIGLRTFFVMKYGRKDAGFSSLMNLIELVERMMRVDPGERIKHHDCYGLPFLDYFNSETLSDEE